MTHTQVFKKRQGIIYEGRGRAGRQTKITWALIIMRTNQKLRHHAKQYNK